MSAALKIEPESWQELPNMPIEKWEAATIVVDGKIFILGGYGAGVRSSKICHIFDPADHSWTRIQDLPSAISHVNPVLDGRKIWFAGGFKDGYKDHVVAEVWNYDIDLDGPGLKGRFTAGPLLPGKRGGGGLALVGRQLHFIGGITEDRDTDAFEHWVLDLDEYEQGTGQWRDTGAPIPEPRNQFSTVVFDNKIYLIGGQLHHDSCQLDQNRVDIYDPETNSWSDGPVLPKGHSHSEGGTFVHDGKIFLVGGHTTPGNPRKKKEDEGGRKAIEADILTLAHGGEWELFGKLPMPLSSPAARIVDGRFYVLGGSLNGGSVHPQVWVTHADRF